MSRCDVEDLIMLGALAEMAYLAYTEFKKRERRKFHPYSIPKRIKSQHFPKLFEKIRKNDELFKETFHIDCETFDSIFKEVEPFLRTKKAQRVNDEISPLQKFAVVFEYYACGTWKLRLASAYGINKQRFGQILDEVSDAIVAALKEEIPALNTAGMLRTSETFNKWNVPNCLGAIAGKHIEVRRPKYSDKPPQKDYLSTILMVVVDGDFRFTHLNIRDFGSRNDASAFNKSALGSKIMDESLEFPEPPTPEMPFLYIADNTFPLHQRIMKPYLLPEGGTLTTSQKVFNYRLNRVNHCVENCFGILCSKFHCLSLKMYYAPERTKKIVAACCYLHNFLLRMKKDQYCPANHADTFDENGDLIPGDYHKSLTANAMVFATLYANQTGSEAKNAEQIRETLTEYFMSEEGAIASQMNKV